MKKFILLCLITLGVALQANSSSAVSLNIKLHPIQSLVVNADQKEVVLDYQTRTDYSSGVTSKQQDHLSIFSTGGFEVKVKANDISLSNDSRTISVADVLVTPYNGSTPLSNANYTSINLSTVESILLSSDTGGVDKTVSVDYAAKGNYEYINLYQHTENANIFKGTVIYTINPK